MGQFGDKFRKAREGKELTLDDVSNVTKISPRMLQAIEEENFDRLPGGVFNKGFIRAYAKHLGHDPEEAITQYLDCLRQAQVAAQQAWEPAEARSAPPVKEPGEVSKTPAPASRKVAAPAPLAPVAAAVNKSVTKAPPPVGVEDLPDLQMPREANARPPARTTYAPPASTGSSWRLVVVAGLIFLLGIALWTRRSHTGNPQPASSTPAPSNPPVASSPAPTQTPGVAPVKDPPGTQPSSTPPATSAGLLQSPPVSPQPSKPDASAAISPSDASSNGPSVEEKNDVTIRTFGNPAGSKAADNAAASFTLVIRATENSWLSIVADGQPVRQETLIAPAHTSVHATREVVVKVGNAAGVSFLLNGKEISPQGNEAEPKTLVFDRSGLRTAP